VDRADLAAGDLVDFILHLGEAGLDDPARFLDQGLIDVEPVFIAALMPLPG
jgi:hypothetical protein